MKVAALDLGSNTFLCLICDVDQGKIGTIYSDDVQVVRLGQGLSSSKKFHPDALARAKKTLTDFAQAIAKHEPEKVLAMATSAARDAENKEELFKICKDLNIPLEIISGDQEAQITYSGSVSGMESFNTKTLVVDIGGGSTEFIVGLGPKLLSGHSQNIGCVRLTEKYIPQQPTSPHDVETCKNEILKVVKESKQKLNLDLDQILAVAGTPTALVTAELGGFDSVKIDGYKLTTQKLNEWLLKLTNASVEEKQNMGIPMGRADVILVGVLILLATLEVFCKDEIIVSTRGVRYGVAIYMESKIS
ncbi:MAG: Ppx/GppA family phosphatase [Bdellovibrionaceae bacterium]|nr:Ppx/GppA family phosphatase [Pseudobdellovibrionaceae bacterium]